MRSNNHHSMRHSRQSGVGMVEVLVALVVVSIGVLGMASLQLTGIQHSTGGYNRAKALLYAENIATRMRTNRPAIDALLFEDQGSADLNCSVAPGVMCQTSSSGVAPPVCTPAELATYDIYAVSCGDPGPAGTESGVVGSLPNGQLTIVCGADPLAGNVCSPESTYTITIAWTEGQRNGDDLDATINRRVQMRMRP